MGMRSSGGGAASDPPSLPTYFHFSVILFLLPHSFFRLATCYFPTELQLITEYSLMRSHTMPASADKSSSGVAKLLDDMRHVMNDTSLSDVLFLLEPDDQQVHAHRIILKNRCAAFETESGSICTIPGAITSTTGSVLRVKWPNTSASHLSQVLLYVYTGLIEINDKNVFAVYSIAQDLRISELEEQCKRFIRENLTMENACVFLPEALRQSKRSIGNNNNNNANINSENCEDFARLCTDFIGENASQCLKSAAFLQMDKESVIHIISSDSLAMAEEDIWRSVLDWARSKTSITEPPQQWSDEQRQRMAAQLSGVIEHVRILQIESQVFAEEVEPTGVVPIQISLERYRFAALPDSFREKLKNPASDARLKPRTHCKLFEGSQILSGDRSHLQKVLNSLFGVEKQCWKLLFRASSQGFSAAAFHTWCDGQENTMTVVLSSSGCVCAGFTDAAWFTSKTSLGKCVTSERSFLCSLRNASSRPPLRFDIKRKSLAMIHHPDHGPIFGAAPDLLISDNCNSNNRSISFLGHSYEAGSAPSNLLMGENYFSVADYEVFQLI